MHQDIQELPHGNIIVKYAKINCLNGSLIECGSMFTFIAALIEKKSDATDQLIISTRVFNDKFSHNQDLDKQQSRILTMISRIAEEWRYSFSNI
ncbi:MAG: hypothetical protein EZS28_051684 [Streblomastix strix]|uniref:Uncharacterized protein n=1 Tax=Streblomastix strix TaxID=222440 RepID=A0A5J4T2Q9_9EUKA|nr:MAG: hypothetical protein EZS28_051684 [Streblomastix strix]